MKYPELYADVMRYTIANGITGEQFGILCGMSRAMVSNIARGHLSATALEAVNKVLGTNHQHIAKRKDGKPYVYRHIEPLPKDLPAWVRYAPTAIRHILEQEYYVDPEHAKVFAECQTVEDIRAIRRQYVQSAGDRVASCMTTHSVVR